MFKVKSMREKGRGKFPPREGISQRCSTPVGSGLTHKNYAKAFQGFCKQNKLECFSLASLSRHV